MIAWALLFLAGYALGEALTWIWTTRRILLLWPLHTPSRRWPEEGPRLLRRAADALCFYANLWAIPSVAAALTRWPLGARLGSTRLRAPGLQGAPRRLAAHGAPTVIRAFRVDGAASSPRTSCTSDAPPSAQTRARGLDLTLRASPDLLSRIHTDPGS